METADLRYPIGKFQFPAEVSDNDRELFIEQIAETPANLRASIEGLSEAQFETPYRPDGWTIRTRDEGLAAHFEHTVAITKNGARILT